MEFQKYVGAGNDFILVEEAALSADRPALARAVCDRHWGVGADGLLIAGEKSGLPVMDYYNADGTGAVFCGNGLRCFAAWWAQKTGREGRWFSVLTACGARRVRAGEGRATVEMGVPSFLPCPSLKLCDCERTLLVKMNVPHLVAFYAGPLPDVATLGPQLEHHPAFGPAGVNVNFARPEKGGWRIQTWERGCGQTAACGTGCCAVAAAAGLSPGGQTTLLTDGGSLQVRSDAVGRLWLTGPAQKVCEGRF